MLSVEVLLKLWQLVQVPPLFAETLTWIPKLHWWGSSATAHGPKPWPEGQEIKSTGESARQAAALPAAMYCTIQCIFDVCLGHANNSLPTVVMSTVQLQPSPKSL